MRKNKRLPASIQLSFLNRLSRSLSNGYSLLAALETLKWDKTLQSLAIEIIDQLKRGISFEQALERLSFHSLITTYIYFSKEHSDLEESILQCIDIYEQRLMYKKKFAQAIRYPIILTIIFTITFMFIQQKVLPYIMNLFQTGSGDSFFLMSIIHLFSILYISLVIIGVIIGITIICWKYWKHRLPISKQIRIYQAIPFYRSYLTLNTSFLFSTHFGSLLGTGLSIRDVLIILANQSKLPLLSYYATQLTESLNNGRHISMTMSELSFISPQLASIFQKNTNQEELKNDLTIYATFLTEEINQRIIKFITYIQPIFFIVLGLVIIMIYLSIMLPMYQLIETF
ncbi:competence type IV pilus assembly protein ComGB [Ornithinibacillus halotolerans]|uniref:competence type IV pilus assembly protein ComGB n=1 Tax=Ornithinibacillus halotolerans TaxID=1274357 RepID=UPI0016665627|nr:competence type IV pilus assembly protein ComGB [Ornithinibacillus halotolerans]